MTITGDLFTVHPAESNLQLLKYCSDSCDGGQLVYLPCVWPFGCVEQRAKLLRVSCLHTISSTQQTKCTFSKQQQSQSLHLSCVVFDVIKMLGITASRLFFCATCHNIAVKRVFAADNIIWILHRLLFWILSCYSYIWYLYVDHEWCAICTWHTPEEYQRCARKNNSDLPVRLGIDTSGIP